MSASVEPFELPCLVPDGDLVHLNLSYLVRCSMDLLCLRYDEQLNQFELRLEYDTKSLQQLVRHQRRMAQKGDESINRSVLTDLAYDIVRHMIHRVRTHGTSRFLPEHSRMSNWELLVALGSGDREVPFWTPVRPSLRLIETSDDLDRVANALSFTAAFGGKNPNTLLTSVKVVLGRWVIEDAKPAIDPKAHTAEWRSALAEGRLTEACLLMKYWPVNYSDPHAAIGQFWRMASERDNMLWAMSAAKQSRLWHGHTYNDDLQGLMNEAIGDRWTYDGRTVGDNHYQPDLYGRLLNLLPWEQNFPWQAASRVANQRSSGRGISSDVPMLDDMAFLNGMSLDSLRRGARPGGLTNVPFTSEFVPWNRPEEVSNRVFSEELLRHAIRTPRLTKEQRMRGGLVSPASAGIHLPITPPDNPWQTASTAGEDILRTLALIARSNQEISGRANLQQMRDVREVARELGLPDDFSNEVQGVPPKDEEGDE